MIAHAQRPGGQVYLSRGVAHKDREATGDL